VLTNHLRRSSLMLDSGRVNCTRHWWRHLANRYELQRPSRRNSWQFSVWRWVVDLADSLLLNALC